MKTILSIFFFLAALACFAQPTEHQRIFLEILDNGQVIPFGNNFNPSKIQQFDKLVYKNYVLTDEGRSKVSFSKHSTQPYFYKKIMTDAAHLRLVKDRKDTMNIEIYGAFDVFFLQIPFQKGNFRLDLLPENRWYQTILPKKEITGQQFVYDITPSDWTLFEVNKQKENNYSLSKLYLTAENPPSVTIPEDDPNFRNQKKYPPSNKEIADFNFDQIPDYKEQRVGENGWKYFIFNPATNTFEFDSLLSSFDIVVVDAKNEKLYSSKTTKLDNLSTQTLVYEIKNQTVTLIEERVCTQKAEKSERTDCSVAKLKNGVWVYENILGAE